MTNKNLSSLTVFLGLGSSQSFSGKSPTKILEECCTEIQKLGTSFEVSSFIKSDPWGGVAKNLFVNAVCKIDISIPDEIRKNIFLRETVAENFLEQLQRIELKFGRVRDKNSSHWGDRTLDIDILFFGEYAIDTPLLKIPHPYIWKRNFVYEPLRELITQQEESKLPMLS